MRPPVQQWLALKRQQLLLTRELEPLKHISEELLRCRDHDAAAREIGLELTRPRADLYFYDRDPELAAALQQLEHWRTRVLELQQRFRQDCIDGRRSPEIDFEMGCRLTVQLRRST